jgi:uncharacterized protein YhfF
MDSNQQLKELIKCMVEEALKDMERLSWIIGNTTAAADKANKAMEWGARTGTTSFAAVKAAQDIAVIAEDVICKNM